MSRLKAFAIGVVVVSGTAAAYAPLPPRDFVPAFQLTGKLRGKHVARGGPAYLAGSAIAALGDGALVIDSDSGSLVRTDRDGNPLAMLAIGPGASELVVDRASERAYVVDRRGARIAVVSLDAGGLAELASIATPIEPYGIALAPDARTLLVTAIADRSLVAFDAATGEQLWREPIGPEPRGVAIAPDGAHALVTHVTTGDVEQIDLRATRHRVTTRALRHDVEDNCRFRDLKGGPNCVDPNATSFARAAFAARFLGNDLATVAFQRESPIPRPNRASRGSYGGSALPISRHLAFISLDGQQAVAQISVPEPRALAWDAASATLYVAGMGDDGVLAITDATTTPRSVRGLLLATEDSGPCGAAGLAVADDGDVLAWCALSRRIARTAPASAFPKLAFGPELANTRLSDDEHAGLVEFTRESRQISFLGRFACATCHVEGRSDGLAWAVDDTALRTPVLAGRLAGTAPYKWSGRDRDLPASIAATVVRLGGFQREPPKERELAAYISQLPRPPAPARDAAAVARGEALFESSELGCAGCHIGPTLADGETHPFTGAPFAIDTPSLVGLAANPRFLHDGSAPTLDAVLRERGSIRGMIARPLSAAERADLSAFLETQ